MSEEPTRRGKIASLPAVIREELCQRLHDGQRGPQILPWLHSLPEVQRVLNEQYGEDLINAQNLTDWRQGGFLDWKRRQEKVENLKVLSAYAGKLAQAGGSLAEGAAAIAGGKILEMLEGLDEENAETLIRSLSALRSSEASHINAKTNVERTAQKARQLDLEEAKFRRTTAEMFIKWYENQAAKEIVSSREGASVKMDRLVELMFGKKPGDGNGQNGQNGHGEDGGGAE